MSTGDQAQTPGLPARITAASAPPDEGIGPLIGWALVVSFSLSWATAIGYYLVAIVGLDALAGLGPHELAAVLLGVAGPIAVVWLIALVLDQRRALLRSIGRQLAAAPPAQSPALGSDLLNRMQGEREALKQAGDAANEAARSLGAALAARTEDLKKATAEAREARSAIGGALDALSSATRSTTDALTGTISSLESQVDQRFNRVVEGAKAATNAAAEAGGLLQRQADSLAAIGDNTARTIDGATARIGQSLADMDKAAGRIGVAADGVAAAERERIAAIDGAASRMEAANSEFSDQISAMRTNLGALEDRVGEVSRRLAGASEQIAGEMARLEEVAQTSGNALAGAFGSATRTSQTMNEATEQVIGRLQQVERSMRQIVTASQGEVGKAVTDLTHLGEALRRLAAEQAEISASAGQKATAAREQLRKVADEIANAGNEATARVHAAGDALRANTSVFESSSDLVFGKIEEVGNNFDKLATRVGAAVAEAQTRGIDAARVAGETARELSRASERLQEDLKAIQETVETHAATIGAVASRAAEQIDQASDRFGTQAEHLDGAAGQAAGSIDGVAKAMQRQASDIIATADHAVQRLNTVVTSFRQRADALADAAAGAERRIGESAGALGGHAQILMGAAETSEGRLERVGELIGRRSRDLESATERAAARIDGSVQALQRHVEAVGSASSRATTEAQRANTALETVAAGIDERISGAREQVADAERGLGEFVAKLEATAQGIVASLNLLVETLNRDDVRLAAEATEAIGKLREMGQAIAGERAALVESSVKSREEIEEAIVMATKRGAELKTLSEQTALALGQISQNLSTETKSLTLSADEARRMIGDVAQAVASQVTALTDAAARVDAQRRGIEDSDRKMRKQAAMAASASVVDGLNALSVDLSRTLEDELPEEVWRRYLGGEKGIFARRLGSQKERSGQERIANKYRQDGEFRTYVDRYLRQFDELIRRAADADDEDVLIAALRSSDVGKLHRVLTVALGRDR